MRSGSHWLSPTRASSGAYDAMRTMSALRSRATMKPASAIAARSSTVRSAIAEAGFMVALERNADIVRMASYAPLLARVGDSQWEPDLIYFTDDAVLGSAAYDVHRLFAEARGDQVLDVQV